MATPTLTPETRAVVTLLREQVDPILDRIVERIIAEVPIYLTGGIASPEVLRDRVSTNIQSAFAGLLGEEHDAGAADVTGRLRARQNMPLADVLTSYRLGYSELWAAIATTARHHVDIPPQVAIELGQSLFNTYNLESEAVTEGYRAEAQHLVLQRERERTALLDVLLADDPGVATLVDVAHGLRLPLEGTFLVVAAATEQGLDPMPRVSSALAAVDVASAWRLTYDTVVGVLSLRDVGRNDAVLELLGRHAIGPVGVSPPFTALGRTSWALDQARMVLRRLGTATGVEQVADSPLNMLVVGGREAARTAAETVLGRLLDQPPATRDLLLDTLHTWLDGGGSADRAGDLLHCHPNTVRKRLKRLEDLTGRVLAEPRGVAELVAASHAWQQLRSP